MAYYEGHHFDWDATARTITITGTGRRSRPTPKFGLGNATIILNLAKLPINSLIQPITDDSTGQGILPTSPFKLKRWYALPEGLNTHTVPLTGYDGWSHNLTYPLADGGSVKQVTSAQIIQNGYGCEEIVGDAPRLNW